MIGVPLCLTSSAQNRWPRENQRSEVGCGVHVWPNKRHYREASIAQLRRPDLAVCLKVDVLGV